MTKEERVFRLWLRDQERAARAEKRRRAALFQAACYEASLARWARFMASNGRRIRVEKGRGRIVWHKRRDQV